MTLVSGMPSLENWTLLLKQCFYFSLYCICVNFRKQSYWGGGTNWTKFGVVSELKSSPCHLAPASFSRDVVEHLSFGFFLSWVCPTASPPHKFSTIYQPQSPCSTTLAPSQVILRGLITDHLKVKTQGLGSDNKQYYKNKTNKHFFP